jgi:hypothetical protein
MLPLPAHTLEPSIGSARRPEQHNHQAVEIPGGSARPSELTLTNSASRRRTNQAAKQKTGSSKLRTPSGYHYENPVARTPRSAAATTEPHPDRDFDLCGVPRRTETQGVTDNLKPAKSSGLPTSAQGTHHLTHSYSQAF